MTEKQDGDIVKQYTVFSQAIQTLSIVSDYMSTVAVARGLDMYK